LTSINYDIYLENANDGNSASNADSDGSNGVESNTGEDGSNGNGSNAGVDG
jgi:hypothetical protein